MKIKRLNENKTKLVEEDEAVSAPEAAAELNVSTSEADVVSADASTKEIEATMIAGAKEEKAAVNVDSLEAEAEEIKQAVKPFILNPYSTMTGKPGAIKEALQRCLETSLRNKRNGVSKNFPSVIIVGLAGFGKTSIVQEFCEDHNMNLFECDAKNLDPATVGGIPYPKTDSATGEITQAPISSEYWNGLEEPNTILFLDEINRANGRTRGSLLTLINEHKLPASIKDPKTGKFSATKTFPNILFSVIAINPADSVFEDNEPLDPAMISRHAVILDQGPDKREFLGHLNRIYGAIENNANLDPAEKAVYAGQHAIAQALIKDPGFSFDDADEVKSIYQDQMRGNYYNYLNYRSFMLTLLNCNGTKNDYLEAVKLAKFSLAKTQMIKNILATYTDKVTTGNNVFNKGQTTVNPQRAAKASIDAAAALDAFADSLE